MPEHRTIERAQQDKRAGKSPSTQAGEFVREEFHHVRQGKHGARSARQAIAIGLSKARRSGVDIPDKSSRRTKSSRNGSSHSRKTESRGTQRGQDSPRSQESHRIHEPKAANPRRSRATSRALKREGHSAGSHEAISRQARSAARQRSSADRSAAARKAARTKGPAERSAAARKAARTRAAHH